MFKEAGDYILYYPPEALRTATAPVNPNDAFAYDYHPAWTVLGFGQQPADRPQRVWGGELQYHLAPFAADARHGLLRRTEYGAAVALKSVPYRSEEQKITRSVQTNVLFAPNLAPLPYLNATLQGRLGAGIMAGRNPGLVAGFDLAWTIGAADAHYPLRVAVGYEHNSDALPISHAFALKIGFNN
ncbi:hypothetical protein [Hymenobacter cheonanensis]|uniref:hypothetical protein n=1 Tax=Hymenobacter sp. CA2-7 TaxID=3063993 RepID=UPI0027135E40|nr:hypothetical protein [Hymenobacter sp. CA2-7]MDO7884232.1 hypothetical protein [Hymenobacter sp. CA2-7]